MDYYSQKIYIAQVDKEDTVLGKIERWEAHKKGILHRAFSVVIQHEDSVVLQHRKHPVFDDVFDLTVSSHQQFIGDSLQTDLSPIYATLNREFNIEKDDYIIDPHLDGKIYYKAKDSRSEYLEHEVCHFYSCTVKNIPKPNLDFAYGFALIPKNKLKSSQVFPLLAPWVVEAFHQGVI